MFNLKRFIFTMLIMLICGFAHSQSGYVYNESLPIVRIASRSIYVCSDNSVVVLSSVDDTMDEWWYYHLAITKLDPDGNLLWRQWLNPGGWPACTITGVDIDAEDTVTFIVTWIGSSVIQLATIDSDGVVAPLSDPIDLPYFSITFNKALRTPNNEIVAVGKAYQHDWVLWPDVSSACYFRFSSAGDTLATAFWPVDQGSSELVAEAYDLALMDNGNILIACRLHTYNCSILEVNPDGTLVNRFDLQGEYHSYNVAICRESNNASYIIAYVMGEYPDHSIQVDRFENGVFEPLFSISLSRFFVNSMILGTDNIYLCGKLGLYGSLLSLTYSGELNWSWEQPGGNMCEVDWEYGSRSAALLALDNEDCIYWAWGDQLLYGTQIITKLLPNGQLPIEDEAQTPPVSTISAYPNPMKDEITIKIKQDIQSPSPDNSIDIFNIKGQLIRSLKLTKGETVWDGNDRSGKPCPKGIYLLRYQYDTSHVTKICKTR